jgi:hypothetical protein
MRDLVSRRIASLPGVADFTRDYHDVRKADQRASAWRSFR